VVRFSEVRRQFQIVVAQLRKHVRRGHIVSVVVGQTLQPGDVTDRMSLAEIPSQLASELGNVENAK
jgi:hypothetical protein